MKKIIKALKLPSAILLIVILSIACDKEFNTVESDVLGKDNSNFSTNKIDVSVLAYNKKLEALQINNLQSNLLGVFKDPAYGKTTASLVTQLLPSNLSPVFGDNTVLDSVVLRIPYYSSLTGELDSKGNAAYSIDSLYGNTSGPIKLSIYQNNYLLRDLNPDLDLNEAQNYFSDAENTSDITSNFVLTDNASVNFDDHKGELIYENPNFIPSSLNTYLYSYNDEGEADNIEVQTPSLRVKFNNTEFWKTLIIDKQDDNVLTTTNNFKNYFRGLYIKAENINDDGSMVLLNTESTEANIILYYSYDSTIDSSVKINATYTLGFTGNTLNTYINDYNLVSLEDGDDILGDEKLYLKGTEGSMAVVDLFGNEDTNNNEIPDALESLREEFSYIDEDGERQTTRLINEAILIVYEDDEMRNAVSDDYHTYDRLYVYDVKNNITAIDYDIDASLNLADPFSSIFLHLGQRGEIGDGFGYKIRITEHINNILLKDSTNTKLGLVISNNVNYITNSELLNSDDDITEFPAASIITPRGTIIHGSHQDVPESRRMKLEIYYTEPN